MGQVGYIPVLLGVKEGRIEYLSVLRGAKVGQIGNIF